MFTWICPQCGREVPPSYTECPDCAARAAKGGTAPSATTPSAPAPQAAVQPTAPPAPVQAAPPQYCPPAPRGGIPTWLLAILFALAFVGAYWIIGYFKGRSLAPAATVESPSAKPGARTNPLQRYVEVSAVRFTQDPKKKTTIVKFALTNHSEADISGLVGNVTIWGRTQKSEEDAQGTFTFSTNLAPFESKQLEAPLVTKLKIYELPDWQNITTDVQITAPAASTGSASPR
jgi:hypothetical protein